MTLLSTLGSFLFLFIKVPKESSPAEEIVELHKVAPESIEEEITTPSSQVLAPSAQATSSSVAKPEVDESVSATFAILLDRNMLILTPLLIFRGLSLCCQTSVYVNIWPSMMDFSVSLDN